MNWLLLAQTGTATTEYKASSLTMSSASAVPVHFGAVNANV
jgi:hypothetical protein